MPRSLGDKRRQIPPARARDILKILSDYQDGDTRIVSRNGNQEEMIVSRVFPTTHFGFRKVTVERPLRLNFQAVRPHVPDAWIDESKRDAKDGEVGVVGYEINFNRYFYRYSPPRSLEDIEADIQGIEADIVRMLREVTASTPTQCLKRHQEDVQLFAADGAGRGWR